MTKADWLSILRSVLTFAGTFIIGKNLLGHAIDSSTFEIVAGSLLAGATIVWGVFDKSTGIEQIASFARSTIIGLGGIGVAWGLISANTMAAISSLITAIMPVILSQASKATVKQIASGKVAPAVSASGVATGKVAPQVPPKPDTNVVVEPKKL